MNESVSEFSLFCIWVEIVFHFQFNNLFLSFTHLFVKCFKGLFQHGDGLFKWFNCFCKGLFDQNSTDNFPAFSITFEWLNIGQNERILSSFIFQFKISFEDFSVLGFEFIIIVHDLLWDWHFYFLWIFIKIFINFKYLIKIIFNFIFWSIWFHNKQWFDCLSFFYILLIKFII